MRTFEYHSPPTLSEALELLEAHGEEAKILAGGTDLIVQMTAGEVRPRHVIDLKRIRALQGAESLEDGGIRILPLTRIADLASMESLEGALGILRNAASTVGSVQIRNRATVGGNICRAAPSADMAAPLLVLNSRVKILGTAREHWLPLAEFFLGPGRTALEANEILAEIHVPPSPSPGIGVYLKLGPRETMDLATVGAAVFLSADCDAGVCRELRIALASVAPKPMRAQGAEKHLKNQPLSDSLIAQTARKASEESSPITDVYGPDWYKRKMVEVLVKRAILEAWKKIRGKR